MWVATQLHPAIPTIRTNGHTVRVVEGAAFRTGIRPHRPTGSGPCNLMRLGALILIVRAIKAGTLNKQ